jgi:hypothetical protein
MLTHCLNSALELPEKSTKNSQAARIPIAVPDNLLIETSPTTNEKNLQFRAFRLSLSPNHLVQFEKENGPIALTPACFDFSRGRNSIVKSIGHPYTVFRSADEREATEASAVGDEERAIAP